MSTSPPPLASSSSLFLPSELKTAIISEAKFVHWVSASSTPSSRLCHVVTTESQTVFASRQVPVKMHANREFISAFAASLKQTT